MARYHADRIDQDHIVDGSLEMVVADTSVAPHLQNFLSGPDFPLARTDRELFMHHPFERVGVPIAGSDQLSGVGGAQFCFGVLGGTVLRGDR